MNLITLQGKIISDIVFSHEIYNEKFYRFTLSVKRKNDVEDLIPIEISSFLLKDINKDDFVCIDGSIRTQNVYENERKRLYVKVFAKKITKLEQEEYINEVVLQGFSVKPCTIRSTKVGKDICDVCLSISRAYNKTDYVPVIVWNRQATLMSNLELNTEVGIKGHLQSRYYEKKNAEGEVIEQRTVLEVSAYQVITEFNEEEEN